MKRQLKEKSVSKNTTPSESARFSNSNHKKIYSWLILALCILLYANTIQNGYVLDDKAAITQNTLVKKGISSIPELFKTSYWYGLTGYNDDAAYRPVSLIMFAAEWQLFPDNPHISHLVNILIYGLICVLLFELLIGLFPSWPMILKLIAVLLFAAHPVHTEVVANIKSRDELMALLFSIYAFLLALKFSKEGRLVNLILIPVALILAMFSKESAFTMVALLPLTLYAMVPGTSVRKGLIILTTVITCILYILIRDQLLGSVTPSHEMMVMDNSLMSTSLISSRYATAIFCLMLYILKLIFPYPLAYDYSFNEIKFVSITDISFLISALSLVMLFGLAIWTFRKHKIYLWSILFFFISISVVSNIPFYIGSTFAERFLFVPSIAFVIPVTYFFGTLFNVNQKEKSLPDKINFKNLNRIFLALTVLILMAFSIITVARNTDWKSELTLFESGVRINGQSSRTHCNYGDALFQAAKAESDVAKKQTLIRQSIDELNQALKIYEGNAEAHRNLGSIYLFTGDSTKALEHFLNSEKYEPGKAENLQNIGYIYGQLGQFKPAMAYLHKSLRANSSSYIAWNNLGRFYGQSEMYDSAAFCLQRSISLSPDYFNNYLDLGTVYAQQSKLSLAALNYEKALSLDPQATYILINLANLYIMNKDYPKALQYTERFIKANPGNKQAFALKSYIYTQMNYKPKDEC